MTINDIYDCFTMEHFRLRQRMTLTTKIYCSHCTLRMITTINKKKEAVENKISENVQRNLINCHLSILRFL
jgi:hypothetical protein